MFSELDSMLCMFVRLLRLVFAVENKLLPPFFFWHSKSSASTNDVASESISLSTSVSWSWKTFHGVTKSVGTKSGLDGVVESLLLLSC